MKTSIVGYPRIGSQRELKFASEKYFNEQITREELLQTAAELRRTHWEIQHKHGIDFIPAGDFSLYDGVLDTACLLDIIPQRYRQLQLDDVDTYFAMARGYQGVHGDVKALPMRKWFNTNYHYIVPELSDTTQIRLAGTKPFDEFVEAQELGFSVKPVIVGPFTLLKLARYTGEKQASDFVHAVAEAYAQLLVRFGELGAEWVQFDEPALVTDLTGDDIELFLELYAHLLSAKGQVNVLLQTYFGDIRDSFEALQALPFDGIGIDFVEGAHSLELLQRHGLAKGKILFAGVVNGKNIWRHSYRNTLELIRQLRQYAEQIVLSTSCSLLHVPYTLQHETGLPDQVKQHFAFAEEKLEELSELKLLSELTDPYSATEFLRNDSLFASARYTKNEIVQKNIAALTERDFRREPSFTERQTIQRTTLQLPSLPTTTIGSFPQTADVRRNRSLYKKQQISEAQYKEYNREKIADCIQRQEEIGLDVLVHGEFERNDMVEYFGECLDGFLFTEKAWVQSYGTRCVKPPIIWGDVSRSKPITVEYSAYAQSLTEKPVKGMLTGPVTILNWSFPREDISLKECAFQIALAIREEVLDLEASGIKIIQIDEAALREKLPLRKSDWHQDYLDWAIPAFRLVHSGVQAATQIHTHMCYSEFTDILADIDAMDADVITFEASRSDLAIIDAIHASGFQTQVGPGVYDIHSPRVPSAEEIEQALRRMVEKIEPDNLWINPDCGLKTRGEEETWQSLEHMVQAAKDARESIAN